MTLQVERATDKQRADYQTQVDLIDAQRDVVAAKIGVIEAKSELSDIDHRQFDALKIEDDALNREREVLTNAITKMDIGNRDAEDQVRNEHAGDFMRWAKAGPSALAGNTDQLDENGDWIFDYDDVTVAQLGQRVNTPSTRPTSPGSFPNEFEVGTMGTLIRTLKYFGAVRQVCNVFTTPDSNPINQGTLDDTARGSIISETATAPLASTSKTPVNIVFQRNLFRSEKINMPMTINRDAPYNYEAELGRTLGMQLGRAQETVMTRGGSASTALGVVANQLSSWVGEDIVGAAREVTTATGDAANAKNRRFGDETADRLIERINDTRATMDPAYLRDGGEMNPLGFNNLGTSIVWMMNSETWYTDVWTVLAKDDSYLVQPGGTSVTGAPIQRLLGYPVVFNQDFATAQGANRDFLANADIWTFGNMLYYTIRDIGRIRMHRDPYGAAGDNAQTTLVAFAEMDARYRGAIQSSKCQAVTVYAAASS